MLPPDLDAAVVQDRSNHLFDVIAFVLAEPEADFEALEEWDVFAPEPLGLVVGQVRVVRGQRLRDDLVQAGAFDRSVWSPEQGLAAHFVTPCCRPNLGPFARRTHRQSARGWAARPAGSRSIVWGVIGVVRGGDVGLVVLDVGDEKILDLGGDLDGPSFDE